MSDEYGRKEWRTDKAAATAEAQRRVAAAAASGTDTLDLSDLTALTALPAEIARLPALRHLFAGDRRPDGRKTPYSRFSLSDITPLTGLPALATLDLSCTPVANLTPLSGLPALATLDLSGTPVTNLTPLTGLPALATLNLTHTPVENLTPLSGLPTLASLSLSSTKVTNLTPLTGLPALATLNLTHTPVENLTPLSGLPTLASLSLSSTKVTNLTPLTGLPALAALDLTHTQVENLTPLSGLPALASLSLSSTKVTNLTPLSGLPALAALDLRATRLEDITPLSGLPALAMLDLSGTGVTDIGVLLTIPRFAEERALSLNFQKTPAADPGQDRRLHLLSLLDEKRCAFETVQYLKGTHPDFSGPPGGAGRRPLAERLAAVAPVGLVVEDGRLTVTNPGEPETERPRERAVRLVALRRHVATLQAMAVGKQVPSWFDVQLAAYAAGLEAEEPTFIILDGPMAFLRGGAGDSYLTEALDGALMGGWRALVAMHDDLRPHLMPPEEEDDLPPLTPEATPQAGIKLANDAIAAAKEAEGPVGTASEVAGAFSAMKDYFEAAKANVEPRPGMVRRGFKALAGTLASVVGTTATVVLTAWLATPAGQSFLAAIKPILEAILKFFPG